MTKADLVEKVTGLGDLTRRDGEVIVETIFGSVIGALQSGDKIEIRGFGSKPASVSTFPPKKFLTSNLQRSCATWSTPARLKPKLQTDHGKRLIRKLPSAPEPLAISPREA
jgi:hypothetical protein